jgi:hypothetical protein
MVQNCPSSSAIIYPLHLHITKMNRQDRGDRGTSVTFEHGWLQLQPQLIYETINLIGAPQENCCFRT